MKRAKIILSVFLSLVLLSGFGVFAFADCEHQYDPKSVVAPTCTEKGYTEYVCRLCGDSIKNDYVEPSGHFYGEWQKLSAPGCTETGLEQRICRVCHGVETRTLPMLPHKDANGDSVCDTCDYIFEAEEDEELSPYEWLKLFFQNIIAWFRAIFA